MNRNYWCMPATNREEVDKTTKVNRLIKRVCEAFEVSNKELKGKRNLRHIVEPRKVAMYIMREHYKITIMEVGNCFNRHHSTVLASCKSIEGFMQFDRDFKNKVNNLI